MKQRISRPKDWTEKEKQQLERLARRGVSASEIADTLGRHTTAVRQTARNMNLLLRKEAKN